MSFKRSDTVPLEAKGNQSLVNVEKLPVSMSGVERGREIVEAPAAPVESFKIEDGLPALGSNFIFRSAKQRERARWVRIACYTFIPAALAILWALFFISPLYTSEAHFTVKAEAAAAGAGMADISKGAAMEGVLGGIVDGYAVRDYLTSREAFNLLRQKIDYGSLMQPPGKDDFFQKIWESFGLASKDSLFDTFESNLKCRFNVTEQSVILDVYAYDPEDAQRIADQLVAIAEDFANRMNQRARQDWLHLMEGEVHSAEAQLSDVRTKITQWRNQNAAVDPTANATAINEQIAKLEDTLTGAQTTYDQLVALSAQSPRKVALENTIRILTNQVEDARKRLGGVNGDKEFVQSIADFEALQVEQDSAEKHLQTVRDTYELARIDTIKQQRYISSAVRPSIERAPAYPNYYTMGLGGSGIGLTILAVLSLLSTIHVDGSRRR